jgi:alpha-N-arabinofuranosidase
VVGVSAGLALNGDVTPRDKLQPFIDDALDQIEFIRGPVDSKWGKRRAELGHPEPFKLEYVEVGNEDWLPPSSGSRLGWDTYVRYRFTMFLEAINARYPDITVIASSATSDGVDGHFDIPPGTGNHRTLGDYHPYRKPDDLVVNEFNKFDNDPVPHIIGISTLILKHGQIVLRC